MEMQNQWWKRLAEPWQTGVTYHSFILTVTWHLKEPLEMKASPWGLHIWLLLLIISSKFVKKEKIRFEKVKRSATCQDINMRSRKKVKPPVSWPCSSTQFCTTSPIVKARVQRKHTWKTYISWIISSELNQDSFTAQTEYFPQDDFTISLLPMCIPTACWNYKRRLLHYPIHKTGGSFGSSEHLW